MNTKFLSVLLVAVLAVSSSYAQTQFHVGIRTGLNATSMHGSAVPIFSEDAKIESRTGFQIGVMGELEVNKFFAFQPGILFSTQGYAIRQTDGDEEVFADLQFNYIQVPLDAVGKLSVGRNSNIFLKFGPYLGYALSGKQKFEYKVDNKVEESESDNIEFGSDGDTLKRLDFGVGFGLGYQAGHLQFALGVNLGMMNLSNDSEFDMKNTCTSLSISYFF